MILPALSYSVLYVIVAVILDVQTRGDSNFASWEWITHSTEVGDCPKSPPISRLRLASRPGRLRQQ
jgi:hypothetical protein